MAAFWCASLALGSRRAGTICFQSDCERVAVRSAVPQDVTVSRQVLADPTQLGPDVKVWARLADGTPLVTASALGDGQLVLFHVTANSDWSNLPLSGLFVEMLRRISTLGRLGGTGESTAADTSGGTRTRPATV